MYVYIQREREKIYVCDQCVLRRCIYETGKNGNWLERDDEINVK